MRKSYLCIVSFFGGLFLGLILSAQLFNFRLNGGSVSIGMTKNDVIKHMGCPNAVYDGPLSVMKYKGELWAYGKTVDLSSICNLDWPIVYRFLSPESGDYVIFFDANGKVSKVNKQWSDSGEMKP